VSTEWVVGVLDALESFAVRRSVCGVPTNRLRRIFSVLGGRFDAASALEQCQTHLAENPRAFGLDICTAVSMLVCRGPSLNPRTARRCESASSLASQMP
jgi:hypothetical protein